MNEKLVKAVKLKIRDILKKRGISVYQLSNMADISGPCIRNWYSKRDYIPSLESLAKVCDALGISIAELFLVEGQKYYPITIEQKELLQKWQNLSTAQKNALTSLLDSFNKK